MTPRELLEQHGFHNIDALLEAAEWADVPVYIAATLLDMESYRGKNVFGSDSGGMFKGQEVTRAKYEEMVEAVAEGHPSNGVGPTQVTHRSFFPQAEREGFELWEPRDNLRFGFRLLKRHYTAKGSWQAAATAYNGKPEYGVTFARRMGEWKDRLEIEEAPVATWFPAPSLIKLRDEVDAAYPGRSKKSDGLLGDAAHSARVSQHNPNRDSSDDVPDGAVTAIDITATNSALREKVLKATIGSSRVWYVISQGKIYSRTYGWAERDYTGSNPHDTHIHVSLRQTRKAVNDTSSWSLGASTKPDPSPQPGGKYTVQAGDTLSAIADKFGVTVEELVELNSIADPDVISVGQVLILDKDDEPAPAPKPSTKKFPILTKGDSHELVPFLKRFLFRNPPNQDNKFGKLTYHEVRRYQKEQRLVVDGVVGPKTWAAIAAGGTKLPAGYTL